MEWCITTVMPDLGIVFLGLVRTPPEQRNMAAIETAAERLGRTLMILDEHLAERSYMAGDRLTIGDIPLGAAFYRYTALPIKRPDLPEIDAWYGRLRERPAFHDHVMIPVT